MVTSISFDRAAHFYDDVVALPVDAMAAMGETLSAATALASGSRVLEIGVGTGRIAAQLNRYAGHYVGVDISLQMLRRALTRPMDAPILAVKADAACLPFATESFDLAVCCHVFHVIADGYRAVAEIARTQRPTGRVLLLFDGTPKPTFAGIHQEFRRIRERYGVPIQDSIPGAKTGLYDPSVVAAAFGDVGFSERQDGVAARWIRTFTPDLVVQRLVDRVWSSTWDIPDAKMAFLVQELRMWVNEQFDSADEPLSESACYRYIILQRPTDSNVLTRRGPARHL